MGRPTAHSPIGEACAIALTLLAYPVWATDLPAQFTSDTTLTAAGSPYYLRSSVTINVGVTVTVEAGAQIIAAGNHRIYVNGALLGAGTAAQGLVFRAADGTARGAWEGIYVAATGRLDLAYATVKNGVYNVVSPGGQVRLDHCALRLAAEDALYGWGALALTCTACDLSSNTGRGLYLEGFEASGSIASCSFSGNGGFPAQLKATLVEMLGAGNVFRGNGVQRIGVSCSMADDITDSDTWARQSVPLELGAGGGDQTLKIAAGGRLNIAGGNTVLGTRVDCYGRFEAWGSDTLYSVWRSRSSAPAPGDWAGLVFYPGSIGNLRSARVQYAVTGLTADDAQLWLIGTRFEDCQSDGARLMGNTQAIARDCWFQDNGGDGLQLSAPGLTGWIRNCRFIGNGGYPVRALAGDLRCLQTNNQYQGNGVQRIGVECDQTPDLSSGEHVWVGQGVPLDLAAAPGGTVLNIGAAAGLTINAGQTLYLGGIDVAGRLTVSACSANPCVFLPPGGAGAPGSWTGIRYLGGSGALIGARVRYAASAVTLSNASPRIRECVFSDSQFDGLRCLGASAPVIVGTSFVDNGRYGVYVANTARPNLGDLSNAPTDDNGRNTLAGNGAAYDVYNDTAGDIRAQNNVWSSDDEGMVAARIFDRADLSSRGEVVFRPLYRVTTNEAPALSWEGSAGYGRDGVSPEVGSPAVRFHFKVKYRDPEGDAPAEVRLHLARGAEEIAGSPFAMTLQGEPTYETGAVFARDMSLAAGRDYRCWFAASDGTSVATGAPTRPQARPLVTTPPTLTFTGQAGYGADGVNPDSGPAGTTFRFRCRYTDADDDEPVRIVCHVLNGGAPMAGSPFDMTALDGHAPSAGRIYQMTRALGAGSYSYRFEATDGIRQAVGAGTQTSTGPSVTGTGPGVMASAGAQVSRGVVRVHWQLTSAAIVDIRIRNLAGRIVAEVCRNQTFGPGGGEARWGRKLGTGVAAPPGPYLVVLQARTVEGWRQQVMIPLWLR